MDFEKQIKADRESLIQDIIKLVSINSVEAAPEAGMPFGAGPAKALDCFLEIANSMGLTVENFDNYAGHADYGEQDEILGILGHVDVVPCSGNWICDPFKPEIIDGKLYGRGVLDDKGPLLACLHAVKILKAMELPLQKRIRFIVGANEETDWKCMDYYFNQKKIPAPQMSFTPDAVFPLIYAEKGVFQYQLVTDITEELVLSGGNAFNAVADLASVLLPEEMEAVIRKNLLSWETQTNCHFRLDRMDSSLRLTAEGIAAHAAHPSTGINAISGLMKAVSELPLQNELSRIAAFYMKYIGFDLTGKGLGIDLSDEISGKLSFNVGKVEVQDYKVIFSIDNRVPVTYRCMQVQELIQKHLSGSGFRFENPNATESIHIPKDSFLVQALLESYRTVVGDSSAMPLVDGACSYARALDNCVAFGALLPDQPDLMHQTNEYLELDKLDICMKIYLDAIYRLAK